MIRVGFVEQCARYMETGMESFFQTCNGPRPLNFIYTLTPASSFPHFVLAATPNGTRCFLDRVFNPILLSSSPSHFFAIHLNRITFSFFSTVYIFIYRKTRGNERTRSFDRGEKLGNFKDPIETCQPLIPPLKEKLLFHPVAGDELH